MISASFRLGSHLVGAMNPAFVIAEAGVNHCGRLELALELISVAAKAGADAVKFQTFETDQMVTADAPLASYQSDGARHCTGQRDMLRALELPRDTWRQLRQAADDVGIMFLSTPFDEPSLELLISLDVAALKISSGDLTNHRLLSRASAAGRPVICSTGMATVAEISSAVDIVRKAGADLALLHCLSSYPAPADQLNLRAINFLERRFRCVVGYSDHYLGGLASIAAATLGAKIIEKHLTLDRSLPGPDHRVSAEPDELAQMVQDIRAVEPMLGVENKRPQPAEQELRTLARRRLTYANDLPAGFVIGERDLVLRRAGSGIPADGEAELLGRRLRRKVRAGTVVELADFGPDGSQ